MIDEVRLACLLLSYEADEPHVSLPGCDVGDEVNQYYAKIDERTLASWLASDHCGDCTTFIGTCQRCRAEMAMHKAKWLIERMQPSEQDVLLAAASHSCDILERDNKRLRHLVAEAGRMLSVVTLDNEVDFASWTEVIEAAEEITGDMLG